jgi:hypothetical protein
MDVIRYAADRKKTSHGVFLRPAGAHHFIGPLPGMLSPANFRQSSGLMSTLRPEKRGA